jgi:hypothetical protein
MVSQERQGEFLREWSKTLIPFFPNMNGFLKEKKFK